MSFENQLKKHIQLNMRIQKQQKKYYRTNKIHYTKIRLRKYNKF